MPGAFGIRPVESDVGRFFLNTIGLDKCGKRRRNAREHESIAAFLLQFYLLPVDFNLVRIVGFYRAEHMGMAENQFGIERIGHIADIESTLLARNLGIEYDVEQDIAQLFFDVGHIFGKNSIAQFVHLLDGIGAKTLKGLLAIPWAFYAEPVERIEQTTECLYII